MLFVNNSKTKQILFLSLLLLLGVFVAVKEIDKPPVSLLAEATSLFAPSLNERLEQLEIRVQQLENQSIQEGKKIILSEEEQRIRIVEKTFLR